MKSYSHTQQDEAVVAIFGADFHGFFLDIGAADGEFFSNTLALEEQFGWTGICIEASPGEFAKLQRRRPRIPCLQARVGAADAAGQTSLRTLLRRVTPVPAVIDYFSLDVDGGELEILRGFPWESCRIRFATVEHDRYSRGPAHKEALYAFLSEKGMLRVVDDHSCPGYPYEDWYAEPGLDVDWAAINAMYQMAVEYWPKG